MDWKIGQRLVCVQIARGTAWKQSPPLTGIVQAQQGGWVTIVCPTTWIVVSRYQAQFEQDGWQLDSTACPETHQGSVTTAIAPSTEPVGSK